MGDDTTFGYSGTLVRETRDISRTLMDTIYCDEKEKPKDLRGAQFLRHAEADSLYAAFTKNDDQLPKTVVMYVEKPTCPFCKKGLPLLMQALGVEKLVIYQEGVDDKDNPYVIDRNEIDYPPGLKGIE
jgi:deoxycytidylate deaminase